jgi:carbamoyltransferase
VPGSGPGHAGMNIVGVHDGHNATAALLRDGVLVAVVQEERITRVKNQGGMPNGSIEAVLRLGNLERSDVDLFSVAGLTDYGLDWHPDAVAERVRSPRSLGRIWLGSQTPVRDARRRQLIAARRRGLADAGLPPERTKIVEHHHCHAAAAYFANGELGEPVLVLTADGVGDFLSATVNVGHRGEIRRVAEVPDLHSLGALYAAVTFLMGMSPLDHEYKVMGLAPYGSRYPEKTDRIRRGFAELFEPASDGIGWRTSSWRHTMMSPLKAIERIIVGERFDCVAAGLQEFLEEAVVAWVGAAVRATGVRRVAVAGGLFMNVKANQRVLAAAEVETLFVMPSCGDESNALGAAYTACWARDSRTDELAQRWSPLGPLYLGDTITTTEAQEAAGAAGAAVTWHRASDPEQEVAELIAAGNPVGRAAGRMEFGARSLGNRSLLADPSRPDIGRMINDMIKQRDFWMPFAPSVVTERSTDYVEKPKPVSAPYMMQTFDARPDKRDALIAASHPADNTLRIQEVSSDWNPEYHALLTHLGRLTGAPAVLNTSFNLHGFPIVSTAADAVDVFMRSGLEYLQLADVIVEKTRS